MKQVKNILAALFWTALTMAVLTAVVFESDIVEPGVLAGVSANGEFLVTTLMELLTLASVPLALKLFRFKKVHSDLVTRKAPALRTWGLLRLGVLGGLLVVNTLLYYIYMNTAFGYMALILVVCLPFVYPSMDRCIAETEEDPAENVEDVKE